MTQAPPPIPADYAADRFENKAISLHALFTANVAKTGQMMISGKTFENCVIEGPAVLLPTTGVDFDGCDMGQSHGDPRNLLLKPMAPDRMTGVIPFQNTTFRNCRFFAVGFTGSDAFLNQMVTVLKTNTPGA